MTGGMYSCKQNLSVQNENEILSRKVNLKLGRIFLNLPNLLNSEKVGLQKQNLEVQKKYEF